MDERLSNKFDMTAIESAVNLLSNSKYNICAFGTGEIGTGKGVEFVELFGKHIDFYCDNNPDKWGTVISDNVKCISLIELEQQKDNTICFILAGRLAIREIYKQLDSIGVAGIIPYDDVVMHTFLTDKFYDFDYKCNEIIMSDKNICARYVEKKEYPKGERIAVYTCIVGGYDSVKEPLVVSSNCDYYLVSDCKPDANSIYKWIDINDVLPDGIVGMAMKNRCIKMFPHRIFMDYKYSIYIDGSIKIIGEIDSLIKKIGNVGIAAFSHPVRKSIYQEGVVCALYGMADEGVIKNQLRTYCKQGMPDNYGLFEMNVIVRKHNNPICKEIMEQWWEEINKWSKRDQLAFTYVVWKNGYSKNDVGLLGDDISDSGEFLIGMHN